MYSNCEFTDLWFPGVAVFHVMRLRLFCNTNVCLPCCAVECPVSKCLWVRMKMGCNVSPSVCLSVLWVKLNRGVCVVPHLAVLLHVTRIKITRLSHCFMSQSQTEGEDDFSTSNGGQDTTRDTRKHRHLGGHRRFEVVTVRRSKFFISFFSVSSSVIWVVWRKDSPGSMC